jgi:hypothetical protein
MSEPDYRTRQEQQPIEDDITNLYIVQIENVRSSVTTKDGSPPFRLQGELLLYGEPSPQGEFTIQRLRRLTLFGERETAPEEQPLEEKGNYPPIDPLKIVSLAGPDLGSEVLVEKYGIEGIVFQLHYRLLSFENPLEPRLEKIRARLTWDTIHFTGETLILENVRVITEGLIPDSIIVGYINAVETDVIPRLELLLAGSGSPYGEPLSSIPGHCGGTALAGPIRTVERRLPIQFVNLTNAPLIDVAMLCEEQLVRQNDLAACPVWRRKAALNLVSFPNTSFDLAAPHGACIDGSLTDKPVFGNFDDPTLANYLPQSSPAHIKIYIVETLNVPIRGGGFTTNGGITYFDNLPDAVILLQRDKLGNNPRLLAHELCHVIGLDHPGTPSPLYIAGSSNSIASPAILNPNTGTITPSPARNTDSNFSALLRPTVNANVGHTGIYDFRFPDP